MGALWQVVKEIQAAAKAEWIVFRFIEGLALGLFPECLRVLWDVRARGRRGRVAEQGVWFHLAELSVGIARST